METRDSNKKKKLVIYSDSDGEPSEPESEESDTIDLDFEEIARIAIQEMMMHEDFQKELFKPMIIISATPSGEGEEEEQGPHEAP